jgi:hypothetical protein
VRLVDLSAPIEPTSPELPDLLRTEIAYHDHAQGAAEIERTFGVPERLLRDREGWALEVFTHLGTHGSTHVAPPGTTTPRSPASPRRRSTSFPWTGSTATEWFWT